MFDYGPEGYNYADFILKREIPLFERFRDHLHVAEKAPSFDLLRLDDGERVSLSDYWKGAPLVIEFGSFT